MRKNKMSKTGGKRILALALCGVFLLTGDGFRHMEELIPERRKSGLAVEGLEPSSADVKQEEMLVSEQEEGRTDPDGTSDQQAQGQTAGDATGTAGSAGSAGSLLMKSSEQDGDGNAEQEETDISVQNLGNVTVKIEDKICENGNYVATITGLPDGASPKYVWYKKVNDEKEFKEVTQAEYTGTTGSVYNITEDGSALNIAIDGGTLSSKANEKRTSVQYKVKAVIEGREIWSDAVDVLYWNELQNGSFETPDIAAIYPDATTNHTQMSNAGYAGKDGVWQTTGPGMGTHENHDIEIIQAATLDQKKAIITAYDWYAGSASPTDDQINEFVKAYAGNQFVELNCEAEGALYQDVSTIKGESLNYWFAHRARGNKKTAAEEKDTMYVVIMPTSLAMTGGDDDGPVDTEDEVREYIRNATQYAAKGVYVRKHEATDQRWEHVFAKGAYTPVSYLTRFFFVAGETASGNKTVGNFLDDVGFSQSLPPVKEGEYSLTVKKTVKGLKMGLSEFKELISKQKMSFEVRCDDSVIRTLSAAKANWTQDSHGNFTATFDAITQGNAISGQTYQVNVIEKDGGIPGYTLKETTVAEEGNSGEKGKISFGVKEGDQKTVEYTNVYEEAENNAESDSTYIRVKKTFSGLENPKKELEKFAINLYQDVEGSRQQLATLKLEDATAEVNTDGTVQYVWKIEGLTTGTYYIQETGAGTEKTSQYKLEEVTVNGNYASDRFETGTQGAKISSSISENGGFEVELRPQANRYFCVGEGKNNVMAARLLNGKYLVWTLDRISANERDAILKGIAEKDSGSKLADIENHQKDVCFVYGKKSITYFGEFTYYGQGANGNSESTEDRFEIADTNIGLLDYVWFGQYTPAVTPEIEVTNTYKPKTMEITIEKFGSSYDKQIGGATFHLYTAALKGSDSIPVQEQSTEYQEFEAGSKKVSLPSGYYVLEETQAPSGYQLLGLEIYFYVDAAKETIELTDSSGSPLTGKQAEGLMWRIQGTNKLQIKNLVLYSLPETGGIGTTIFTVVGCVVMIAAVVLFLKNRKKK